MKTLLNKKLMIAIVMLLCITSIKAQVPDRLKNLPPFQFRSSMLSLLHKPSPAQPNARHCSPNAYCLKKQTVLGGTGNDQGQIIIPTHDEGFIVCGTTNSYKGELHTNDSINGDAFLAKYNKFRKLEWTKTYGGSGFDGFSNIVQTWDGGYVAVGGTFSNDGDVSGNHGGADVWVVKVNASGKIIWQKCYGGTSDEFGNSLVQNFYGGYAIVAETYSNNGDVSGNHSADGLADGWFIKINAAGKLLYQHCYGGSSWDVLSGIVPSGFGSFIVMGAAFSDDGDVIGNHGNGDIWALKLNSFGKIIWEKTIGGSGNDFRSLNAITNTTDGNTVIAGYTNSTDGDVNASNDTSNSLVIKLDAYTGKIIWLKTYREPFQRSAFGIFATKDGGIVETGNGGGNDVDFYNVLITKYDKNGNEEWYKLLGGSDFDLGLAGYETRNGDLNILAQTASTDGDIKKSFGGLDTWLLKLSPCGNYIANDAASTDNAIVATKNNTTTLLVYPNPVSNSATISFSLLQSQKAMPTGRQVSVAIYDMNGRLIKTLANEQMQQGSHQLTWNARDEKGNAVGSGIYVLKLQAGDYIETKKILVVK